MTPLIIEGSKLVAPLLLSALKSAPTTQLARYGLLRAPVAAGIGGTAFAFVGGAALTALAFPQSRAWLAECSRSALNWVKEKSAPHEPGPSTSNGSAGISRSRGAPFDDAEVLAESRIEPDAYEPVDTGIAGVPG